MAIFLQKSRFFLIAIFATRPWGGVETFFSDFFLFDTIRWPFSRAFQNAQDFWNRKKGSKVMSDNAIQVMTAGRHIPLYINIGENWAQKWTKFVIGHNFWTACPISKILGILKSPWKELSDCIKQKKIWKKKALPPPPLGPTLIGKKF